MPLTFSFHAGKDENRLLGWDEDRTPAIGLYAVGGFLFIQFTTGRTCLAPGDVAALLPYLERFARTGRLTAESQEEPCS